MLVSGVLMALQNEGFSKTYIHLTNTLATHLVDTIRQQLRGENLPQDKINNLMENYRFLKSHPSLTAHGKGLKSLRELIDDIDENINGYSRTYKYYDVLGQFYIEFLRYSNADKGLGIVLTPPHITNFFTDVVGLSPGDVVLDNCTGTSGFLVSSMKKMSDKCAGDSLREKDIKQNRLHGIEYQPEIYPLAVSNMFLHGDGKSNIIGGNCFDSDVIQSVKDKKPDRGFSQPSL